MKIIQIQFVPWDKVYNFDPNNLSLEIGDKVVVKTELGVEIGTVAGFTDLPDDFFKKQEIGNEKASEEGSDLEKENYSHRELKPILRKANIVDLEKLVSEEEKKKALDYCKTMAEKYQLPMKLVDVHFAFDGSRITFAFISEGRVDFRELVKELTRHFNRTIRLQQIGIRDEAKVRGDYGPCGRQLCCVGFLKDLSSVTSEMAEIQQCAHRGSDRLSGVCGRLKCCLSYEIEGYKELAEGLPAIGARVDVDGRKGVIVGHHILKQSVDVEFFPEKEGDKPTVLEVDLKKRGIRD